MSDQFLDDRCPRVREQRIAKIKSTVDAICASVIDAENYLRSYLVYAEAEACGLKWGCNAKSKWRITYKGKPLAETPVPDRLAHAENLSKLVEAALKAFEIKFGIRDVQ